MQKIRGAANRSSGPNREKQAHLPSWGWNGCKPLRFRNRKSLEFRRFRIMREKRNTTAYTPFQPQPQENGHISRSGPTCTQTVPARKSRIVGIPPFSHHVIEAGHNGAYPLEATTRKKRSYLPVRDEPDASQSDLKIANRWKMAVSESYGKSGIQRNTPSSGHNLEIQAYLSVGIAPDADHSDFKITDRWNSTVFESCRKSGTQRNIPLPAPTHEIRAYLPGWGLTG